MAHDDDNIEYLPMLLWVEQEGTRLSAHLTCVEECGCPRVTSAEGFTFRDCKSQISQYVDIAGTGTVGIPVLVQCEYRYYQHDGDSDIELTILPPK